jgi:two-component sensor histidine kinase
LKNSQKIIKIALLLFAMAIAVTSLFYTNILVQQLGEREQKLIDLYSKGLKAVAQPDEMGNLSFLFQEIIEANNSVPVILTDDRFRPISFKNLDIDEHLNDDVLQKVLEKEIQKMSKIYPPIEIEYSPGFKNYIFYRNSFLLEQLKLYPYIQLTVIFLFILAGYLALYNNLKAEQDRVWVGMAKETAHQLGTPLSSLMAWIEYFKMDQKFSHPDMLADMENDVRRLETVASRFSNIGSIPTLRKENLYEILSSLCDYLRKRVSKKIEISLDAYSQYIPLKVNRPLFEWAIENIIKNAVDAIQKSGKILIKIKHTDVKNIVITIEDNGKGMNKKVLNNIFKPGFTTKQRGWGLGLTLTKRIIEEYHGGKIWVKSSETPPMKGTTFYISLNLE